MVSTRGSMNKRTHSDSAVVANNESSETMSAQLTHYDQDGNDLEQVARAEVDAAHPVTSAGVAVDPDSSSDLSTMSDDSLDIIYEALYGAPGDDDQDQDDDDDDEEERPHKRARTDQGSMSASTNQPFTTPPPSSPLARNPQVNTVSAVSAPTNIIKAAEVTHKTLRDLPQFLSPTLPPGLESFLAARTAGPAAQAQSDNNDETKMVIVKKTQLDALMSHNSILRSHNLSLAQQNTTLRQFNTTAAGLAGHGNDNQRYEAAVKENETLKQQMATLRYEHRLMRECGYEWARREVAWEIERASLTEQVDEARACERGLTTQLALEKGEVVRKAGTVVVTGRALEVAVQWSAALQGQVDQLVAAAGPRSSYPAL